VVCLVRHLADSVDNTIGCLSRTETPNNIPTVNHICCTAFNFHSSVCIEGNRNYKYCLNCTMPAKHYWYNYMSTALMAFYANQAVRHKYPLYIAVFSSLNALPFTHNFPPTITLAFSRAGGAHISNILANCSNS